jgi:hypothetical protein
MKKPGRKKEYIHFRQNCFRIEAGYPPLSLGDAV